jgi:hypothetical protein
MVANKENGFSFLKASNKTEHKDRKLKQNGLKWTIFLNRIRSETHFAVSLTFYGKAGYPLPSFGGRIYSLQKRCFKPYIAHIGQEIKE